MKVTYQSLYLELPYSVVEVVEVTRQEGLNRHACLSVTAVIGDEGIEEYLYQGRKGSRSRQDMRKRRDLSFLPVTSIQL